MNSKKAKKLMLDACLRVSANLEVSWATSISIKGSDLESGAVIVHSDYLGDIDDCDVKLNQKVKILNLPKDK